MQHVDGGVRNCRIFPCEITTSVVANKTTAGSQMHQWCIAWCILYSNYQKMENYIVGLFICDETPGMIECIVRMISGIRIRKINPYNGLCYSIIWCMMMTSFQAGFPTPVFVFLLHYKATIAPPQPRYVYGCCKACAKWVRLRAAEKGIAGRTWFRRQICGNWRAAVLRGVWISTITDQWRRSSLLTSLRYRKSRRWAMITW